MLLKASKLKIFMQKFDPYLNVDPGTMNPYQHGEIFVTSDGGETDLDLGHYERFIDENLSKESNITSGYIYKHVIEKERLGQYHGETIQVIPHITNEIKNKIYNTTTISQADIVITEIGGTIGDIESLPFIEAIRQVRLEQGRNNVIFIHVSLIPYILVSKESKTKPTQHSVHQLLSLGIQPDIIVARTEYSLNTNILLKIALFCNIEKENVIIAKNVNSIYEVPLKFYKQNAQKKIAKLLKLNIKNTNILKWKKFVNNIYQSQKEIVIQMIGKYIELPDAYLSVIEALRIAGYNNNFKININWIKADNINSNNYKILLKNSKGILIPGGFGKRGFEGKILACRYARENNIPFLGICFGMQAAIIEFARNVCNIKKANSTELIKRTKYPIINIINYKNRMNNKFNLKICLGECPTKIIKNTLAYKLYNQEIIYERHRHRYKFNNIYYQCLKNKGMVFSGFHQENNIVEIIELSNHLFFIASQYHPEFTSRPYKINPLFNGFIKAVIKNK